MRFYVVVDGKLEEGFWCDNADCPNYATREGISKDSAIECRFSTRNGPWEERHFCSEECRGHVVEKEGWMPLSDLIGVGNP